VPTPKTPISVGEFASVPGVSAGPLMVEGAFVVPEPIQRSDEKRQRTGHDRQAAGVVEISDRDRQKVQFERSSALSPTTFRPSSPAQLIRALATAHDLSQTEAATSQPRPADGRSIEGITAQRRGQDDFLGVNRQWDS
jgi:hypothetical protein